MVDFMYCGEVNVSQEQLPAILKTAETLKVKGLAEMPEQNISLSKSVSISSDKSCDTPSMRRKRLRKSSTGSGSGSGSTEHTGTVTGGSEETVGSIEIPTVKTELASEGEASLRHEPSTESEPGFTSQDSVDEESHQVKEEVKAEKPILETLSQASSFQSSPSSSVEQQSPQAIGSKRGRLLIRQNRIKKDTDGDEVGVVIPRVIERQCSEPGPSVCSSPTPSPNLLSVPQPAYLVKQHSSPLLLSPSPAPATPPPTLQVHLVTPPATEPHTPSIRVRTEELRRASSTPQSSSVPEGSRSCHCPVLRPGPALGCNFCWNTIDAHGRILRRKTKYHCPECQTNLCIVPCFQEYHERHGSGPSLSDTTPTVVPTIMKTSSMG